MKKCFLLIILLLSTGSQAGDYSNECFRKGSQKHKVYDCLNRIEKEVINSINKATKKIHNLSQENGYLYDNITTLELERINFAFDTYVNQQCKLIGSASRGTGAGQEIKDCKIRLLKQREKDINYLLNHHYGNRQNRQDDKLSDFTYENKIHGAWNCSFEQKMEGGKILLSTEDSYIDNGKFNSFGTMILNLERERVELEYNIAGTGSWYVKSGKLYHTLEDIKFVNLTNPELDDILNLTDLFPKNVTESSSIKSINSNSITTVSDIDGSELTCSKKT